MRQILTLVALVATVVAAPPSTANKRRTDNTVNVGMSVLPELMDPLHAWNVQQFLVAQTAYQTLVRISESGNLSGDLAQKWEILNDGTRYRFLLRKSARFLDGTPVSPTDICWSLSRHFWPGSPSIVRSYLDPVLMGTDSVRKNDIITGCRAEGPEGVSLTLRHAYPPFLHLLAMPAFGILQKGARPANISLGSGPMTAERTSFGWRLQRSPSFSGKKTPAREIRIYSIAGINDALRAVREGRIDAIWGLPLGELAAIEPPPGFQIKKVYSLTFLHLFFNIRKPQLKNEALRKDLASLIQNAFQDLPTTPFHDYQPHYIPPGVLPSWYYDRARATMTPSVFKARWPQAGRDGAIVAIMRKDWFSGKMLATFERSLADAGIRVELQAVEAKTFMKRLSSGNYDVISGAYMGNFPDPDGFLDPLRENSRARMGRFPTTELMEELAQYRSITNPAKRLVPYARALQKFEEKAYVVPLFRMSLPILADQKIEIPDTTFRYESELWKIRWAPE